MSRQSGYSKFLGSSFLVIKRYWVSKARLIQILADPEIEIGSPCRSTIYIKPDGVGCLEKDNQPGTSLMRNTRLNKSMEDLIENVRQDEMGGVIFCGDNRAIVVTPPFPVTNQYVHMGADISGLSDLFSRDMLIGVILLRLGHYAVGVIRGDQLESSKTGSRYVKSRHRAGGSSQRRFERSRDRLVRELFDVTCRVTKEVFAPFEGSIEYLFMGGERHTLRAFANRCTYLDRATRTIHSRRLDVKRPSRSALNEALGEVWKSRVVVIEISRD